MNDDPSNEFADDYDAADLTDFDDHKGVTMTRTIISVTPKGDRWKLRLSCRHIVLWDGIAPNVGDPIQCPACSVPKVIETPKAK